MEKPLILVVDDEPKMADNVAEIIKVTGKYDAIAAYSAKDAFNVFEKNKRYFGLANNRIRCIVLDIKMPEVDGLQFLKELREKEPWFKIMPVIILTAYEDRTKWAKATSPLRGMIAAYLKKPPNEQELIDTLDRIFNGEIGHMIDEARKTKYEKWDQLKEDEK
ncbi:hypothetical protein A2276_04850 [candidate division WOR-1 bacterium RIFOXYA12_FULL_43_27]|uniref:Response regulatory domain-containing protein n=1 Tax=candidate division WOR-1 bacterium RIFOXYC2_FULL_46_14 TaxID=1802587 RepID=A0A1F4U8D0_UNCSA|nr:MAG: hypothetical protein A2276_04850 [candidate division WOR-1 bacterium RIFOXYA12_FULL_43_27]OGC19995.1 MAG: hypothetical protein A2292_02855 [candidate division WOR-1 bacterium RIFOXYB2_FULL_46_45]OGC32268.1 MAG: hypothetical protein A2232_08590 [candidate division WOR-1 bacterium RIFOXYA2_FULL_46_56]OGC41172.1 MAG: hypothetical protein A2438_07530 [candidate division WOR-1 bacterium RIFOXYC2_FULL_46_14]